MDLISVIVPVYKVEQYLKRCVDSILAQTYQNLEIILVDDGSPDLCGSMCDEFQQKDSRIVVIHQKNGGLSNARNAGIEIAKGSFLAFVDSDDYIAPDFVESLYRACIENHCELAQCKYEYVTGDAFTKASLQGETRCMSGRGMQEGLYALDGAYNVVAWNKLYKKELFKEIRYPDGKIHEDEATTFRIFYLTEKVALVDRYLYGYFTSDSSITRNAFSSKRLDWIWAMEQRIDFYKEKKEKELLRLTLKAYNDGVIDLYFKCRRFLENSTDKQKILIQKVKGTFGLLQECGGVPLTTWIGYYLFVLFPVLYKKLLDKRMNVC